MLKNSWSKKTVPVLMAKLGSTWPYREMRLTILKGQKHNEGSQDVLVLQSPIHVLKHQQTAGNQEPTAV